jgi:hypothetical protein
LLFQADAEVLATDDPQVGALLASGALDGITSHGELELPDDCFIRIGVPPRVLTYGLGLPIRRLMRDPLHAAGVADLAS